MTLIPGIGTAIGPIIAVFVAAALVSFVLTPQLRRFLLLRRIVDRPGARRVNRQTGPAERRPRGGGLVPRAWPAGS